MLESILLTLYAGASIALAIYVRRTFRLRLDWSHPHMRTPVFDRPVRSTGGTGALGAADAISTAALTSASPSVVMMGVIAVAGLIGACVGAGVLPALVGGIGNPGWVGMMALVVAMGASAYIGGCLALPLIMLALGLAPILIGLGVLGFAGMMFWSTFNSGHPNPFAATSAWKTAFDERLDYNVCAAAVSLITLGNPQEISRKCQRRAVGAHRVDGRFAGVYSCGAGPRIAAILDVRPVGHFRDGLKDIEMQFGDQPEVTFPTGAFAGTFRQFGKADEFRSDSLGWTQKPGPNWGKPDQLSVAAQPGGGISVRLINTPCGVMKARRCEVAEPGRVPTCEAELAQQGVKLYKVRDPKDLNRVIAEEGVRRARAATSH